MSSLHYVHRCKVRSLGHPGSANAEASASFVRGVLRASLSTAHLSPGSRGHRPARSLLGGGIRVTGSRLFAWSPPVFLARLGGVPATRLLGCARSGSGLLARSSAAQPFNQPDMPRQAGSCRLSLRWAAALGSRLGSRFAALLPPSSSPRATAAPRFSSSLVRQLVSHRGRPARPAVCHARFALKAHGC